MSKILVWTVCTVAGGCVAKVHDSRGWRDLPEVCRCLHWWVEAARERYKAHGAVYGYTRKVWQQCDSKDLAEMCHDFRASCSTCHKSSKSGKQASTHVLSNTWGLDLNTKTLLRLCKNPYKHTAGQIWFLEKPCRTVHLDGICMQCFKFAMWLLTALLSTQSGNAAILFIACLINVIWYQLQCAWWNLLPTSTVLPESCHIPLKLNCSLLVAALHAKPLWYVVKQASVSKYQVHCSLRQCLHFCTICMPGQRTTSAAKADLI